MRPKLVTPRWKSWRVARVPALVSGGMITKILAAKRAAGSGASTVIAWGRETRRLASFSQGRGHWHLAGGTYAKATRRESSGWPITCNCVAPSAVDPGAVQKLRARAKAFCPLACTVCEGEFSRGDVIAICDAKRLELAPWAGQLRQRRSPACCAEKLLSEIEKLLGYVAEPEMVHRDNLVLTRLANCQIGAQLTAPVRSAGVPGQGVSLVDAGLAEKNEFVASGRGK
jgi:glutamate 5-kinase